MRPLIRAACALALFWLPLTLRAATDERWFVLLMQGRQAGHGVSTRADSPEAVTTTTRMTLALRRERDTLTMTALTEFVETPDGKPLRMRSEMGMGAAPMVTTYVWRDGRVEVNASGTTSLVPAPAGDWLTPAAAERFLQDRLRAGEARVTVRTIDPSLGLEPVTMTRTLLAREPVEVLGRTVPGLKWKVEVDRPQNMMMEEFTDESGEMVRSTIDLGLIKIEQRLADRELALRPPDAPELMLSTLVRLGRPFPGARASRRAQFLVSTTAGDLPDLPSTGAQTFERTGPRSARLIIDLDHPRPTDDAPEPALARSRMIDPQDDALLPLLNAARLAPDQPVPERVRRLRDAVHRAITRKDLSVGFGTSGEAARTLTGDCTEHAVLLAALCRKAGIPARAVSGLVYVDKIGDVPNAFGYHMWTQVLIEDAGVRRWIDADATLPPGGPLCDATHLTIMPSTLADDQMQNFMVTTAPIIGRLKIEPCPPGDQEPLAPDRPGR